MSGKTAWHHRRAVGIAYGFDSHRPAPCKSCIPAGRADRASRFNRDFYRLNLTFRLFGKASQPGESEKTEQAQSLVFSATVQI